MAASDKAEVMATLTSYLCEMFELTPEQILPEATLFEDLGLDSIDAVDLIVRLQDYTGRKIPATEFKSVRTVADVVAQLQALLAQPAQ